MLSEIEKPVVAIETGVLRGTYTDNGQMRVFKGVPYARPPIGPLRWKPPEPAARWEAIRSATEAGPACPQVTTPADAFYTFAQPRMSEDCLYLNVWAPEGACDLPVMVWIHGGALIWGSGSDPWYDGGQLARKGALVVTFNYRLGVFGYLAHPELSAESPRHVSGNYGTLDQIALLWWIKRNIAVFGGNPDRVTIVGESAGALSTAHLMASPLAAGLFHAAVAQSVYLPAMPALASQRFGLASAEEIGAEMGRLHDAPTLAKLRALSADQLVSKSAPVYSAIAGGTTAVVDHWVQDAQIWETFEQGRQAKVPFITSYNSGEQRSLDPGTLPPFPIDAEAYAKHVTAAYGDLREEYLRLYPAASVIDSSYAAVRDAYFGWAAERLARTHSRFVAETWMYYFDHVYLSAAACGLGAFHASDIAFTFGNIGADAPTLPNWPSPPNDAADAQMAQMLMDYLVAFATTGRPDTAACPVWPAFDETRRSCLVLRDGAAHVEGPLMPGMFELQEAYMSRLQAAETSWDWSNMGVAASPLT